MSILHDNYRKNPKKKWIIVGVVLGVLLLPLVALDIKYRVEFAEYDAEVRRIASYLPGGSVEGTIGQEEYPRYQRGDGLFPDLGCALSFGADCPVASKGYLVKVESGKEMDLGRKVLQEAGYEIDPIHQERADECTIVNGGSCSVSSEIVSKTLRFRSKIIMVQNKMDPQGPIGLTIQVELNPHHENK